MIADYMDEMVTVITADGRHLVVRALFLLSLVPALLALIQSHIWALRGR